MAVMTGHIVNATALSPAAHVNTVPGSANIFFDASSTSPVSHVCDIQQNLYLLTAFGLVDGDEVAAEVVFGCNEGTHFAPLILSPACGQAKLTRLNNMLLIPLPIRFRLRYNRALLGSFVVYGQEVPYEYAAALPGSFPGGCSPTPELLVSDAFNVPLFEADPVD